MSTPFERGETIRIRGIPYTVETCFGADGGGWVVTVREEEGRLRHFDVLRDASDTTWLTDRGDEVERVTEEPVVDDGQADLFG
jgi:hypothetical protein